MYIGGSLISLIIILVLIIVIVICNLLFFINAIESHIQSYNDHASEYGVDKIPEAITERTLKLRTYGIVIIFFLGSVLLITLIAIWLLSKYMKEGSTTFISLLYRQNIKISNDEDLLDRTIFMYRFVTVSLILLTVTMIGYSVMDFVLKHKLEEQYPSIDLDKPMIAREVIDIYQITSNFNISSLIICMSAVILAVITIVYMLFVGRQISIARGDDKTLEELNGQESDD